MKATFKCIQSVALVLVLMLAWATYAQAQIPDTSPGIQCSPAEMRTVLLRDPPPIPRSGEKLPDGIVRTDMGVGPNAAIVKLRIREVTNFSGNALSDQQAGSFFAIADISAVLFGTFSSPTVLVLSHRRQCNSPLHTGDIGYAAIDYVSPNEVRRSLPAVVPLLLSYR